MLTSRLLGRVDGVRHGFRPDPLGLLPEPWRPRQVHGAKVVELTAERPDRPEADAVIARTPAVRIAVVTADCIPLLWAHPSRIEVAAVHAGWRGLAAGILERTLEALGGPRGWQVALGPAAGGCCYEVGTEVLAALKPRRSHLTPTHRGHARVELRAVAVTRLLASGFEPSQLEVVGPCTICSGTWPSYRRDGASAGRMLSWIGRSD